MGRVFACGTSLIVLLLSVFLCKRSLLLTGGMNQVWIAKEPQSHIFHLIFLLVFFLFAFFFLKKKKSSLWFNFAFKPVEITGFLLFVKALFSLKRKEYLGTVIWDPGQSSSLAFWKFSSSHFLPILVAIFLYAFLFCFYFFIFFFNFKNFPPPFSCHSVRNVEELKFLKPQLMESQVPPGDLGFGWERKFIYCIFVCFFKWATLSFDLPKLSKSLKKELK